MSPATASVPSTLLAALRRWADRLRGSAAASNDVRELHAMSDHELKDLGIGRSEVAEWSRRRSPVALPGRSETERASARLALPRIRTRGAMA